MDRSIRYIFKSFLFVCLAILGFCSIAPVRPNPLFSDIILIDYSPRDDTTIKLPYPISKKEDPYLLGSKRRKSIDFKDPSSIKEEVIYDPVRNEYTVFRKIGAFNFSAPRTLTFLEYQEYLLENSLRSYWKQRTSSKEGQPDRRGGLIPQINVGSEVFDRIFGSSTIDIRPQGAAELIFGVRSNFRDDPALDVRRRRTTNFDFDQKIQMNVIAKIGDKIEFNTNYNTEATFDFENKLKLRYDGKEDEILKLIEAGDVTLPLNSTLITGSQSLFGLKTQLQFGRTMVTSVFSQQKSETRNITVQGGAQTTKFQIKALDYDENRHFFIAQYFRDNYEQALSRLPIISSIVNITKIEVWVTTKGAAVTQNRNIVAFADLAENQPYNDRISLNSGSIYPDNATNNLFRQLSDTVRLRDINLANEYLVTHPLGLISGRDYEKVENARKLNPNEYTFNSKLGFISLNFQLSPDQVLAIAYQYTLVGKDDKIYQVGEFSDQGIATPNALMVKLLRSTAIDTRIPLWNLMMKNVYNLNAYQVNREDFILNILYAGSVNSVPTGYLLEGPPDVKGVPLIRVMNFDNLTPQLNPPHDGFFDFIDAAATQGGTIQSSSGRIFFTVVEPFGSFIRRKLADPDLGNKYAFDSLYTLTKSGAMQYPDKNKFILEGMYKSSSGSEISLNAINVPRGSVKVTAGGIPLTENVQFTVDYTLGRVRIIDEGILNSGTPVNISLESSNMLNVQTKRLFGTRIEHRFNNNFFVGGTFMNLHEKPITQKVSFGNEPISNTLWGVDFGYQTESMGITRMLDRLPFYSTKTPSRITMYGEFAHFIPGHSKAVGKTGTTYIDDFEGSKSTIDLRNIGTWHLASTPQFQTSSSMFPEAAPGTGIKYGFNKAKLSWYNIDRSVFYEKTSNIRPPNIDKNELSRHTVRPVRETEVFPNADPPSGQPMIMDILNLGFYPSIRGPYNYDLLPTNVSRGLNPNGTLRDPKTRWGGMMKALDNSDFEATNIEYIEFWMMDPFTEDTLHPGGYLYFNLGDVSEDILRDGRKSFENGLPPGAEITKVDTTIWGRVPKIQALVNAFDNDPNARIYQDVGYDGLTDADERSFFVSYLQQLAQLFGAESGAYKQAFEDPSADNFQYFRGNALDTDDRFRSIARRYQNFNNPHGNSPASQQYTEGYPTLFNSLPNVEDINRDNTLSEAERYYQYKVELRPDKMKIGQSYIADILHARNIPLENGTRGDVKWYQFKVPVRNPDQVIGNIQDFRSIRFMRMFFKGWEKEVILRFATLELVRSEWRRYYNELFEPGDWTPNQADSKFEISTVNIEANGFRQPIPYVLPPGIEREINLGTIQQQQKNEQSMVLRVCNLIDGDARGAYKTADFDFRQFKRLKMYVHAEKIITNDELKPGDLRAFIRIGSDFTQNYYEYEVPLEFTPWGTSSVNAQAIWPEANQFDIELEKFIEAKKKRNELLSEPGSNITANSPFFTLDGKNKITVVGNPSLNDVKAIMLGVKNPKKRSVLDNDDGLPKCAEIWFNELRLTDFNNKSGWAATTRANLILADIGNVMVSGLYNTPGFGSIEKRVSERTIETFSQFDVATNIELGKLLPENLGLRIPLHYDYSEARSTPQYNPLDPDILYRDQIKELDRKERDSLRTRTQDLIQRRNLNFMNVRKDRTGKSDKVRLWDIENIDLSYAYSEINRRNIDIQYDMKKMYRGGIGYNFSHNPKMVRPFDRITNIRLIKDFNFYYMPRSISFRTDMNREYNARTLRNKSTALIKIDTTYIKRWDWTRLYDLRYDLTQNLKIEFNANASAFVDEPAGAVDRNKPGYIAIRDSILDEIYSMGTINNYVQNFNINYLLPINKLKLFDWVYVNTRYSGTFHWQASPRSIQKVLGNTIENNNNIQLNANLRFSSLYDKVGFLKKVNQVSSRYGPMSWSPARTRDRQTQQQTNQKADADTIKTPFDFSKVLKTAGNTVLRLIIGLKDASLGYSENNGTLLPGFMPEPTFVGNRMRDNAPGWGFVFGDQRDIRPTAVQNGWLSTDSMLNSAFLTRSSKTLNFRGNFEPLPDLRIELNADRTEAINHQEYFKMGSNGQFNSFSAQQNGSFSVSYILWKSAFIKDRTDHSSPVFQKMKENRLLIAQRLAQRNGLSQGNGASGFPDGYGPSAQDVLIPAFLSAYSGQDPSKISLNIFPKIPLPGWRVMYNGLMNLELFKKYLRNFTISHSYRANYNIGSYITNLEFADGLGLRDAAGNFISDKRIDVVTVSEQFSPLINFDMTWNNSLLTKFEMRRTRNLSLSFVNNQLTEVLSNELVLGLGYRIQNVKFFVTSLGMGGSGRRQQISSDLNLKLDFSLRDNKTVLRRIDEELEEPSAGQSIVSINASADYMMSQNFSIRAFLEHTATNPFISNQLPNSSTFGGISLRFTLAQ